MISAVGVRSLKAPVGARAAVAPSTRSVRAQATGPAFDRDWLNKTPFVPVAGFFGWLVPSAIPVGSFGGTSLFGAFTAQIGTELAKFPTGPSLDSQFWLYMITWHVGLFATMLLGQVGVNGKKQGYW